MSRPTPKATHVAKDFTTKAWAERFGFNERWVAVKCRNGDFGDNARKVQGKWIITEVIPIVDEEEDVD